MSRLLTFNCHEGYVHLLGKLGCPLDIIDGLPGRYTPGWDKRMRPIPDNGRLVSVATALNNQYDLAIAHNLTDLLQLRELHIPKILILHVSLEARAREEHNRVPVPHMQSQLNEYLHAISATPVAVSKMKAASWGVNCQIIRPCAALDEYYGYTGKWSKALRVANQVSTRKERFAWHIHRQMVGRLPLRLVGYNPGIEEAEPASSWHDLRTLYRQHRLYVHTAGARLDDGYNMGIVEAMATGMPVVSLEGSESPIVNGFNGFVGTNVSYLHEQIACLLKNRRLAIELGKRARETVAREFSVEQFVSNWHAVMEFACQKFARAA